MTLPDCAFVLAVERGMLESQAVLLVESLRQFGGFYANCPVYAVSPRPTRQIGDVARQKLTSFGVTVITESLMPAAEEYGPVAKLMACVWGEQHLTCEILVSLDDDMFFAREPDFRLPDTEFFARPVDVKGMCTSGIGDPFDPYWRNISQLCGVDYEAIPSVTSTVDKRRVRASYNSGMIAVRRERGLFQEAERMFRILREHNLSPRQVDGAPVFASTGYVGPEATRWWGSGQAVLSLAATRLNARISIAPPTYNVPVHLVDEWRKYGVEISLKDAVLVHYHWLLESDYFQADHILPNGLDLPAPVLDWLRSRTPLHRFES